MPRKCRTQNSAVQFDPGVLFISSLPHCNSKPGYRNGSQFQSVNRLLSDFSASVFYTPLVLNGSILMILFHMYTRKWNGIISILLIQCPADTVYNSFFFFPPYVTMYKTKKRGCNVNIFLRNHAFSGLSWTGMILHSVILVCFLFVQLPSLHAQSGEDILYISFFSV